MEKYIRYDAEINIAASSELTIIARIHGSKDSPRETKSNERHRILMSLIARDAYASAAPSDSFFQMQEKTTVNYVLIAAQAPKRPRNSVTFKGTSTRLETVLKYHAEAYPAVHAPNAVQKMYCAVQKL